MTYKTHLIGGAQAGVLLAYAKQGTPVESVLLIGAALAGSILPDIDMPHSKICRADSLIGLTSRGISKITKHRGLTHSIPGAFFFAAVFYILAVNKTAKESLIAMTAALAVFLLLHLAGGFIAKLAGWGAAVTYTFGPQIASLATEHGVDLTLTPDSARLCAVGLFFGCIFHMLYDTFSKGGIAWLQPLSNKRFRLALLKTNTAGEGIFAAVMTVFFAIELAACCRDLWLIDVARDFIDTMTSSLVIFL